MSHNILHNSSLNSWPSLFIVYVHVNDKQVEPRLIYFCVSHIRTYVHKYSLISYSDVNECQTDNGGCGHVCSNTDGSFQCLCREGYTLALDGSTCIGNDPSALHSSIH